MLAKHRQSLILQDVRRAGSARVSDPVRRDPHRRRADAVRRAGRPDRRPGDPVAALRSALHRLPRHRSGGGLTTPNLAESETNRAFVRSARRVTVIADHTKWGIVGLSSFADLEDVDTLITGSQLPAEARSLLSERVGQLVIADDGPG